LGASGGSGKEVNFFTEVTDHSLEFCHDFCLQNTHVIKIHGQLVNSRGWGLIIESIIQIRVNKLFEICEGVKKVRVISLSFGGLFIGGGCGATVVVTIGHHCCMWLHALMSLSITNEKSKSSPSQSHQCVRGLRDCWLGVVAGGGGVGVTVIVTIGHHCCMRLHASTIASSSNG